MQALVEAALRQVMRDIENIDNSVSLTDKEKRIARAIHSVDALKSSLKAL